MSAPASAWTRACRTRISTVSSLMTLPCPSTRPSWPWAVYRIQSDIGEDADLRHRILDGTDRAANEVVAIERFLGALGAELLRGVREERNAGNAEICRLSHPCGDPIDAPSANARKRSDRLLAIVAVAHEQWPDEVGRMEAVFRNHRANPRARAAPAHSESWEGSSGHWHEAISLRLPVRHPAGLSAPPGSRVASASSVVSSSHGRSPTPMRAFFHPPWT